MKVPQWLLPVIAIIAALAVGIAAVIISGRFGPTDRVETNVEADTTTTTLYGPSGYGDEEGDFAELPAGAFGESPELGEIQVSTGLPADPDVTPLADAVERIADGGAAGDDIPTIVDDETVGTGSTSDEPAAAEDPCIAAGDCDEGTVMGRIFALVAPPEYLLRIRAFPPSGLCDAPPAGGANLLVFMSRPSDVTVTVERVEGGGAVISSSQSTPDGVATAWNDALAAAEERDALPPLWLCFPVARVEPGVNYRAIATGTASDGTGQTDSTEFNGAGPTHHPNLTIEPIGDGAAVAYAEHTADEQVAVRAYVMPDDYAYTPDCFGTNSFTELRWVYRSFGELTPAETGALLIPADSDQRTAYGFEVPEGSTIIFCASWHPGAEAPSWERALSSYSDSALLRTTDYVLPKVTLVRVDMSPRFPEIEDVTVFGRTQEGMQCGGFSFDPDDEASVLPQVVCDLEGASTDFDVHSWSYRDLGFTGNIVIPSRVINAGTEFRGEATLNIGDLMCIGGCATNPTTRYTVPLASIEGNPTGTVTLQVSWIQGNSNGLVRPMVSEVPTRGDVLEVAVGGVLPWAQPMMDTDERMSYSGVSGVDLSGVASLHLVTDRPVDYTVSLVGLRGETCRVSDATLSTSGHSDGETDVDISGLCFGSFYWATVELTDEGGARSTFAASRGGVMGWPASLIIVPKLALRIEFAAVTTTVPESAVVPGSYITIDGTPIPLGARTCTDAGQLASHGIVIVPVTSNPVIDVRISTVPSLTDDGVYCSGILAPDAATVEAEGTTTLELTSIREITTGGTTITIGNLTLVLTVLA